PGQFQAHADGVVCFENGVLTLQNVLLHEGDVSMATGNIDFDGPVEVTGNVDAGASVHAGGDLVIRGQIRRGTVTAEGSISVEQGIVTGEEAFIRAKGDIRAEFIENSRVVCQGSLFVEKSILHGNVLVGQDIVVEGSDGFIGG